MKKLLNAAFAYGLAGILAGLAYQLLLQVWCCPEYAPLAGVHSHLLVMGMLLFLVLLALEKVLHLTCDHGFCAFYITYNVGLAGAAIVMALNSLEYLCALPYELTWFLCFLGAAFHILLAVGLGLLYGVLRRRIRACSCPAH